MTYVSSLRNVTRMLNRCSAKKACWMIKNSRVKINGKIRRNPKFWVEDGADFEIEYKPGDFMMTNWKSSWFCNT